MRLTRRSAPNVSTNLNGPDKCRNNKRSISTNTMDNHQFTNINIQFKSIQMSETYHRAWEETHIQTLLQCLLLEGFVLFPPGDTLTTRLCSETAAGTACRILKNCSKRITSERQIRTGQLVDLTRGGFLTLQREQSLDGS